MGNLTKLHTLHLQYTHYDAKIPETWSQLTELRSLDLSGIDYSPAKGDQLFGDFFAYTTKLEYLDLSASPSISAMPAKVFDIPSLSVFDISDTPGLVWNISTIDFSGASNLTVLDLSNCSFFGGIPTALRGDTVPHLRVLRLSNNPKLGGPIPDTLFTLSELQVVDLAGCSLTGSIPPSLSRLSQLERLDLSRNSLRDMPDSVGELQSLRLLDISYNQLASQLPRSLCNLTNLVILDLSSNRLLHGEIPDCLDALNRTLEDLLLSNTSISGTVPSSLKYLHRLNVLQLASMKLHGELADDLFFRMEWLETVDLSSNNLFGYVPAFSRQVFLQVLNLRQNSFSGPLPETCFLLMDELQLSNNNFTGPIPVCYNKMTWIRTLVCHSSSFFILLTSISPMINNSYIGSLVQSVDRRDTSSHRNQSD